MADDETADQISYSVVVTLKVGVGIALIIVAHLVLVQKWKAKGNVPPDGRYQSTFVTLFMLIFHCLD